MRRILLLSLTILAVMSAMAATPRIIAHRGYWKTDGSAQNSIRSLVKADSIGCYGSEFDVWLTADNALVVNHNRDINGKDIETGNSAELLQERLPNGELMPTLSQYLDAGKDLKVEMILEVKPHRDNTREDIAVPMIIDMVAEKGLTDRTTYITFSRHAFDLLVEKSGRPVYFLTAIDPDSLKAAGGTGADYNIKWIRQNPDWIGRFHDYGMPVNVWTVSNPAALKYCIEHDVDFITTDTPEDALALVAKYREPVDLTVMTYNMYSGVNASVDSLAAVINAAQPAFVAIQEADAYSRRANAPQHNGTNFITRLGAATEMFPFYAATVPFAGGYYGIGMLSRYPCLESRVIELPNPENYEPRVLLEGVFNVDGRKVIFASTHLSVEGMPTRILQAEFIKNRYADSPYPVILGGDFNALPDAEPLTVLSEVLTNISGTGSTFPSDAPAKKLDYILASPSVKASGPAVIPQTTASDHCPVVQPVTINF